MTKNQLAVLVGTAMISIGGLLTQCPSEKPAPAPASVTVGADAGAR